MTTDTTTFPITTEAYVARNGDGIARLEPITYQSLDSHEVLIDIAAASICHTDVRAAHGSFHMKPPLILGHEASGYVRAIGSNVTDVEVGEAVVLAYASCGKCRRCIGGKSAYCDELMGLNFEGVDVSGGVKGGFFGQSSMGRVARVRERCCVKIGREVRREELRLMASLGCGIQTGAGAILNVAKPSPGARTAIWGGGAVGLSAIMAAKLLSPGLLVLIDNSQAKLDVIPKPLLEGVHIINPSGLQPGETAAKLKALSPDGKGMDFALDCVGNEAIIIEAHSCLDKLGMIINVGSSATAKAGFAIAKHLVQGITMRGTHQGDSVSRVMIPYLIGLWRKGQFPFDELLGEYKFEEFDKATEDLHAGRVIKPLLVARRG